MTSPLRHLASVFAVVFALGAGEVTAEPSERGAAIDHVLFDANGCLEDVRPSAWESAVEFHWGCADRKLVTLECVEDAMGYMGLGPSFAEPGWHCNHPLPPLDVGGGRRVGDVAVGDVGGRAAWAACAVADYGSFEQRAKPYHAASCYEAMLAIGETVNRTRRNPHAVAAGLPR